MSQVAFHVPVLAPVFLRESDIRIYRLLDIIGYVVRRKPAIFSCLEIPTSPPFVFWFFQHNDAVAFHEFQLVVSLLFVIVLCHHASFLTRLAVGKRSKLNDCNIAHFLPFQFFRFVVKAEGQLLLARYVIWRNIARLVRLVAHFPPRFRIVQECQCLVFCHGEFGGI